MKKFLNTVVCVALCAYCSAQGIALEREFVTPPQSVKTGVYWYWMCGNISKEGAVKDLEAMKKAGINRAFIGNIYFDPYEGGRTVKLMSDEWWEVTHTAMKKAGELGVEIGMFNCPGWTQAGGPWVKPQEAMRYLASSELHVKGPVRVSTLLEKPEGVFEDVRVIAYPVSREAQQKLNHTNAKVTVMPVLGNSEQLFDGNRVSGISLPENVVVSVDMAADAAFTARSLTIYPTHSHINATFELQAKVDNRFKTLSSFVIDWHFLANIVGFQPFAPVVMSLEETTAREFRLLIKNRRNEGGIAEIELSSSPRIENYAGKTLAKMSQLPMPAWDYYLWREQPQKNSTEHTIDPANVLDISEHMTADGKLTWNAPAGDWVILRTGMLPTGVTNNPGGPDGTGLEIDKMSRQHVETHFDAFIGKILKRIPAEDRKSFRMVVQDSYESGGENFTDDFLAQFKTRYGYDALPFLPTYFGKVVGSPQQSDRFLWDLRRLVADKIAYDYVGGFRELCHRHGLRTWLENYGHWGFPGEFLMYGGQSDEVAGEYWLPNAHPSWENDLGNVENRAASSCAHIYGKNIVTSESNTSGGPAFSRVPGDAKQRTDKYFAEGVNSTLLHVYVHQPDSNRYPGTNAWFGTEFNRANSWFSHMDLFVDYVRRCNYLLQQGLNVADIAYFIGEDTPKMTGVQDPTLPAGCQFDYINAEVIVRDATVKNGLITLPHGTTYRVLVLPKVNTMRPEVLAKIQKLVADGAVVLGLAPTHSPSLQGQPEADVTIKRMAAALWGEVDGVKQTSNAFGKGRVFAGVSLEEVFSTMGWLPDCEAPRGAPIHFGHRKMGKTDIYFLSNQGETVQRVDIRFRVKGMQPELWNPITGTTRKLAEFTSEGETTLVPVTLQKHESAFVVFRKKGKPVVGARNFPEPTRVTELAAAWEVEFQGKLTNPAPIRLMQLQDLATSADSRVKYFSGNMIYTTTFTFDSTPDGEEAVLLDLGEVNKMAKVWVNDCYVGGVWTPPYSVNISDALKKGANTLRIDVVNTWVNRMIGDTTLPKEQRETWAGMSPYSSDSPLQKSGLIGPVQIRQIPPSCAKVAQQATPVNLFIGTSGDNGQVSPGAAVPFGMITVCPDSDPRSHVGYDYAVAKVSGISINRLSGVGCSGGGGNLRIRPVSPTQELHIDKATEKAVPGYYETTFQNGIKAQLTATGTMAVERYHFPSEHAAGLWVDFASTFEDVAICSYKQVADNRVEGFVQAKNVCGHGCYKLYFSLQSNHPFQLGEQKETTAALVFNSKVHSVEVRIGLSPLSTELAARECNRWEQQSLEYIKQQAGEQWERQLTGIVPEGGTQEERTIFYTSLYRACLSPADVTSVEDTYLGTDGKVHAATGFRYYSSWSLWDTFRTKFPLLVLTEPERMHDICTSLIQLYATGKKDWSTAFESTPTVRTEHAVILLLDAYRKGITSLNFRPGYQGMKQEMERLPMHSPDQKMESAYDLWAMAQIAEILGEQSDANMYRARADMLFEQTWKSEFKEITPAFAVMRNNGLYQGTRWQYRWAAPQYIDRMIAWVGRDSLRSQLSYFFDNHLYNQGNEPDIHVPYLFNKLGAAQKTQQIVRQLLTQPMAHRYGGNSEFATPYVGKAFKNAPEGYSPEMDEDDGTMSAWYVFGAVGLYPLLVGDEYYELTSPIFDRVTIRLSGNRLLVIRAKNRKEKDAPIRSIRFNGKRIRDYRISHTDLLQGGELEFAY